MLNESSSPPSFTAVFVCYLDSLSYSGMNVKDLRFGCLAEEIHCEQIIGMEKLKAQFSAPGFGGSKFQLRSFAKDGKLGENFISLIIDYNWKFPICQQLKLYLC